MSEKPTVSICICYDIEENWHRQLAYESERGWAEHEHESNIDDADSLYDRETLFFEVRGETDPYWPPRELERFEECDPDPALTGQGEP